MLYVSLFQPGHTAFDDKPHRFILFSIRYKQYWFILIPSRFECSSKDRCKLLGIRNLNCPEYSSNVSGSGSEMTYPPSA